MQVTTTSTATTEDLMYYSGIDLHRDALWDTLIRSGTFRSERDRKQARKEVWTPGTSTGEIRLVSESTTVLSKNEGYYAAKKIALAAMVDCFHLTR